MKSIINGINFTSLPKLREEREILSRKYHIICAMTGIKKSNSSIPSSENGLTFWFWSFKRIKSRFNNDSSGIVMESIVVAIVVVEIAPALFVVGIFRVLVRDTVINTYPFVSVIISPHTVVEHSSALLNKFCQFATCLFVFGIFADMVHCQNDFLAHQGTLDSCISVVQ